MPYMSGKERRIERLQGAAMILILLGLVGNLAALFLDPSLTNSPTPIHQWFKFVTVLLFCAIFVGGWLGWERRNS